jgi:CRP-like cAMP-binding protein
MHVLVRKLRALHTLSSEEENAIANAITVTRSFEKGAEIVADGSRPPHSTVILAGTACRFKVSHHGQRQILSFQFPGDMVDLYSYVLKTMDHAIGALTRCEVGHIPHKALEFLSDRYPNLAYALWRDTMVDAAMLNMTLINMGRHTPRERIAHLVCEQYTRLRAVGLVKADPQGCAIPIHQGDLADATGLSLVHVNKTLKSLREGQLLKTKPLALEILDWERLKAVAGFNAAYLHMRDVNVENPVPAD